MNGEKALRRLPFCDAAKNLSLFTFASVSTIPRGACALPSVMAAVNTRPLNSAAAADKSEQLPVFFDPHRLRIGDMLFLRRRFGHAAQTQG